MGRDTHGDTHGDPRRTPSGNLPEYLVAEARPAGPPREGSEADPEYSATAAFAGWELRDPLERRIGRVLRVFADSAGRAGHVEVELGRWAPRRVLLPVDGVEADEEGRALSLRKVRRARPENDGGAGKPER